MSRRRRKTIPAAVKYSIIAVISVVVAIGIIMSAVLTNFWGLKDDSDDLGDSDDQQSETVRTVSSDTMKRMQQGTILTFGADPESTKPKVFIIGDPKDYSRASKLIGEKPSPFLKAVQKGEITAYFYPVSPDKNRSKGIGSLIKSSACRIGAEKTKTGIYTLSGIVKAGDKLEGTENVASAAKLMGMSAQSQCAPTAEDAANRTANNGAHFAEHFQLTGDPVLIAGNEMITNFNDLEDDWVDELIEGQPAGQLIGDNQ